MLKPKAEILVILPISLIFYKNRLKGSNINNNKILSFFRTKKTDFIKKAIKVKLYEFLA